MANFDDAGVRTRSVNICSEQLSAFVEKSFCVLPAFFCKKEREDTQAETRQAGTLPRPVGGGDRIHPENARKSGWHGAH